MAAALYLHTHVPRSDTNVDRVLTAAALGNQRRDRRPAQHRRELIGGDRPRGQVRQTLRVTHRDRTTDAEYDLGDALTFEIPDELI